MRQSFEKKSLCQFKRIPKFSRGNIFSHIDIISGHISPIPLLAESLHKTLSGGLCERKCSCFISDQLGSVRELHAQIQQYQTQRDMNLTADVSSPVQITENVKEAKLPTLSFFGLNKKPGVHYISVPELDNFSLKQVECNCERKT